MLLRSGNYYMSDPTMIRLTVLKRRIWYAETLIEAIWQHYMRYYK